MFRFENYTYLYLLAIIPAFYIIFYISMKIVKAKRKKFGEQDLINELNPDVSFFRQKFKFFLLMMVLAALVVSIANPQFGSKLKKVKSKGIEIVIALDVSNSMLAEDIKPNRLEAAKRAISKLVDKLQQDKLGLIIFAGESFVQIPITNDYSAMKMFLSEISTESISRQGTNIADAIELGITSFTPNSEANKSLIIITDGETHDQDAIEMAKIAAEQGIKIYTIGMGYGDGVPIPIKGSSDFKKDKNGKVVITKLNEENLQNIAESGEGEAIIANNQRVGLEALFKQLNKLEKTELETSIYSEFDNKFQLPLWFALIILLIDILILERKNKHFKKLNLFGKEKK